ncbi:unnamed protein product [Adineta ricciae]|uniref:G-protein coupled receptors family 1 profile domain-containing protein n=1 Tax=Adineta ricciae TaxID=249248 RepID=A0A815N3Y5_ADIRI|nr:unnamed protein product [Adineta ricciae]CAF1446865.1 unnamed protein product [Adineta ricciae]
MNFNLSKILFLTKTTGVRSLPPILSNQSKYFILLILVIPSILAYLTAIGFIFLTKTYRTMPNNYSIIIILFISFITTSIDLPIRIDSYSNHPILKRTKESCLFWWYIATSCYLAMSLLVAWSSLERHLLIFHSNIFNKKFKKIFFYYIPPILIILYIFTFYFFTIIIYPCENIFNEQTNVCPFPCYFFDITLGMWELGGHSLFPTICILLLNCALVFRVYRSKRRLKQSTNWRKYRTMIFQLILIAIIYLWVNIPYSICVLLLYFTSIYGIDSIMYFFATCIYLTPLLFPFVCLYSLPEFRSKMKKILKCQSNIRIANQA